MKALSVQPYWATSILQKTKTVERRTWKTDYRGDLLICASSGPWWAGSIRKHALCVVELVDIVPFRRRHLVDARMDHMPDKPSYAWMLGDPLFVEPFEVKGKLHLFDVDDALIRPIAPGASFAEFAEEHYKPLMRWSDREVGEEEVRADWDDWMNRLAKLGRRNGGLDG